VLLVLAVVAALFAFQETPVVFEIVLVAWAGLGASLGPTVLYCTLVRSPKGAAALAGLVVGGGLAFLLQDFQIDLLLGFTASSVAIVAAHFILIRRDTEEAVPST